MWWQSQFFKRFFPLLEWTLGSSSWGRPGLRGPAHGAGTAMKPSSLARPEESQSSNIKLFESHWAPGWGGRPYQKEVVHMSAQLGKDSLPGNKRPMQPYYQQAPMRGRRMAVHSAVWPKKACWKLVHVFSSCGLRCRSRQDPGHNTYHVSCGQAEATGGLFSSQAAIFPSVFALGGDASKRIPSC